MTWRPKMWPTACEVGWSAVVIAGEFDACYSPSHPSRPSCNCAHGFPRSCFYAFSLCNVWLGSSSDCEMSALLLWTISWEPLMSLAVLCASVWRVQPLGKIRRKRSLAHMNLNMFLAHVWPLPRSWNSRLGMSCVFQRPVVGVLLHPFWFGAAMGCVQFSWMVGWLVFRNYICQLKWQHLASLCC